MDCIDANIQHWIEFIAVGFYAFILWRGALLQNSSGLGFRSISLFVFIGTCLFRNCNELARTISYIALSGYFVAWVYLLIFESNKSVNFNKWFFKGYNSKDTSVKPPKWLMYIVIPIISIMISEPVFITILYFAYYPSLNSISRYGLIFNFGLTAVLIVLIPQLIKEVVSKKGIKRSYWKLVLALAALVLIFWSATLYFTVYRKSSIERVCMCVEKVNASQRDRLAAWKTCRSGSWMLGFLGRSLGPDNDSKDRKRLMLAACECARLALPYVDQDEDRPRKAIELAESWAKGINGVTIGQVREATNASRVAAESRADIGDPCISAAWAAYGVSDACNSKSGGMIATVAGFVAEASAFVEDPESRLSEKFKPKGRIAAQKTEEICAGIVRKWFPQPPTRRATP